jgi:outer membrane usher protein FimD/PapC
LTILPRPVVAGEAAREDSRTDSAATTTATVPADASKDTLSDGALLLGEDQVLLLDVQINGHSIGKIGEFTLKHGQLMARPEELRDLGFRVPASLIAGPDGLINLNDIPGLIWSLDQRNLALHVTVSDSRLLPTLLEPGGRQSLTDRRVIESGTGLTLNYDTVSTFTGGQAGGTGSFDFRAFSPKGILSSGWLAYAGASPSVSGKNTTVRLDSAYTFADVNSLRRYSLGDFVTGGLSWTRPVHLEGAQINSDFSMRPDLVTFPLPFLRRKPGGFEPNRLRPLPGSTAPGGFRRRNNINDGDQRIGSAGKRHPTVLCEFQSAGAWLEDLRRAIRARPSQLGHNQQRLRQDRRRGHHSPRVDAEIHSRGQH